VSFFADIHEKAAQRKLRFLVIGGLAVNRYGFSRETGDLDFLISQNERVPWMQLLADFGYADFEDRAVFIQYAAPADNAWPVDLMLVKEQTFVPMFAANCDADFYGIKTKVPSLEHLLALKLHSLKNAGAQRFLKDFMDVENLIYINQLDIKSPQIRDLFEKYGNLDLHEKISRALAKY
jgi:hypothetical protein